MKTNALPESGQQLELSFCQPANRQRVQRGPLPVLGKTATSREAGARAIESAPQQRRRCEAFIIAQGEYGAIRDEIAAALELPTQSVSPRVYELIRLGLIIETERRRLTRSGRAAAVLVAKPFCGES